MELSAELQRVVLEQRLGFVATVTADGRPNQSPKGTVRIWDDQRLVFADLAPPATIESLATNPHVEVNVVDPIVRKGFRFKGTAAVYTSGNMFGRGLQILRHYDELYRRRPRYSQQSGRRQVILLRAYRGCRYIS